MLVLTERLPPDPHAVVSFTLSLTAEERSRSRHRFELADKSISLRLSRGIVLRNGDLLRSEADRCLVRVAAKPEPVLTAIAPTTLELLQAAYHLGNRHVSLEITATYLRLSPDPVLKAMLEQLGLQITESISPFQPEAGAYGHHAH